MDSPDMCDTEEGRFVSFGPSVRGNSERISPFCNNVVVTSLYTVYNFVPKSLIGQFQRLANYYFLIIGLMMLIGSMSDLYNSPLHPWGTLISLMAVMLFTMYMQARDDIARHKNDAVVNSRPTYCVSEKTTLEWREIQVGDIVLVNNSEALPADMVILTSSEKAGIAYVETSNIDGETNLKIRSSIQSVSDLLQSNCSDLLDLDTVQANSVGLKGEIVAERPNKFINSFKGYLKAVTSCQGKQANNGDKIPLDEKQLLLRGSVLRNTKWVLGLVIYTGKDTKVARNTTTPPIKLSNLEKSVNRGLIVVLLAMTTLIIFSSVASWMWKNRYVDENPNKNDDGSTKMDSLWYLFPDGENREFTLPYLVAYSLTFAILYNNFVPLSMYTTMEFINLIQAQLINRDHKMYDKESDTPAWCRATNLVQELGQIAYIFSDKTGTLTENIMKFKECSVDTICFSSNDEDFDAKKFEQVLASANSGTKPKDIKRSQMMDDFLTIMAVAHTVVAETDEESGEVVYEAESPDEGALCDGAAKCGYVFTHRDASTLTVDVKHEEYARVYKILAINAFNSKRKRMSVVVRRPNGSLVLFAKGADNIMLHPSRSKPYASIDSFNNDLLSFARRGLRTLVLSKRELTEDEFVKWFEIFKTATVALDDRRKLLEEAAELIETNLEVVGATAIEDKLQEGVPETIELLARGGIKLWVATGDKMETAINIGRSCRLILPPEQMLVLKLTHNQFVSDDENFEDISANLQAICDALEMGGNYGDSTEDDQDNNGGLANILPVPRNVPTQSGLPLVDNIKIDSPQHVNAVPSPRRSHNLSRGEKFSCDRDTKQEISEHDMRIRAMTEGGPGIKHVATELALVVSGGCLDYILPDPDDSEELALRRSELEHKLLRITQECNVVMAVRVSPLQKAQIVQMVKNGVRILGKEPVTLAIGDGANDVGMIQAAQVGVGISGREGHQAANSADFSIAKFRFLKRLLLVHGRWNYRRMCKVIVFSFYKNFVIGLTLFFFNFLTAFSGTSLYETLVYAGYNLWLGFQPVCMGIFDIDVTAKTAERYPELYSLALTEPDLDSRAIITAIALSIAHSAIVLSFPLFALSAMDDGNDNGVFYVGLVVYTCLVIAMTYRASFITWTWNKYAVWALVASIFIYFAFLLLFSAVGPFLSPVFYMVPYHVLSSPLSWILFLGVPALTFMCDLLMEYYRRESSPKLIDIAMEIDHRRFMSSKRVIRLCLRKLSCLFCCAENNSEINSSELCSPVTKGRSRAVSANGIEYQSSMEKILFSLYERDRKTSAKIESNRANAMKRLSTLGLHHDSHQRELVKQTSESVIRGDHRLSNVYNISEHIPGDSFAFSAPPDNEAQDGKVIKGHLSLIKRIKEKSRKWAKSLGEGKFRNKKKTKQIKKSTREPNKTNLFWQQRMESWNPIVTPFWTICALIVISLLMTVLGLILYTATSDFTEIHAQYDAQHYPRMGNTAEDRVDLSYRQEINVSDRSPGTINSSGTRINNNGCKITKDTKWLAGHDRGQEVTCDINLFILREMKQPITVYYELENLYQNYEHYFQSRDDKQLDGSVPPRSKYSRATPGETLTCKNTSSKGIGRARDSENTLFPCGLIANSFFNDTFAVVGENKLTGNSCEEECLKDSNRPEHFDCSKCVQSFVPIDEKNIAWSSDINQKFDFYNTYPGRDGRNTDELSELERINETQDGIDHLYERFPGVIDRNKGVKDEHFIVWMRPAARALFRKRWGRIRNDLPANSMITIRIKSRYPVWSFEGKKSIILTETVWKGSRDSQLHLLYFAVSIIALCAAVGVTIKACRCPRTFGTHALLNLMAKDHRSDAPLSTFAKKNAGLKSKKSPPLKKKTKQGPSHRARIELTRLASYSPETLRKTRRTEKIRA